MINSKIFHATDAYADCAGSSSTYTSDTGLSVSSSGDVSLSFYISLLWRKHLFSFYCIVIYITFFLSSLQNKIDLSNCVDTPSTSKSTSKKIKKVIYVTKLIILYTNTHTEVYYFNSKQCQSLITCLYFCRRSETNLVLSPIYESFDVEDCLNLIIFLHFKSFPIRK